MAPGPARGRDRRRAGAGVLRRRPRAGRRPGGAAGRRRRPAPAGRGLPGSGGGADLVVAGVHPRRALPAARRPAHGGQGRQVHPRSAGQPRRGHRRAAGDPGRRAGPRAAAGGRADADRRQDHARPAGHRGAGARLGRGHADGRRAGPVLRRPGRVHLGQGPAPRLQRDPGHRADPDPGLHLPQRQHRLPARLRHPPAHPGRLLLRRLPVAVHVPAGLGGRRLLHQRAVHLPEHGPRRRLRVRRRHRLPQLPQRAHRPGRRPRPAGALPAPAGADPAARDDRLHGRAGGRAAPDRLAQLAVRRELPLPAAPGGVRRARDAGRRPGLQPQGRPVRRVRPEPQQPDDRHPAADLRRPPADRAAPAEREHHRDQRVPGRRRCGWAGPEP